MKNKVLAILTILLVGLSGISHSALPVKAATVPSELDFDEITLEQQATKTLTFTGLTSGKVLCLSYEADSYSEDIAVKFDGQTKECGTADSTGAINISVTALANENQFINFRNDQGQKFGGTITVKEDTETGSNFATIPLKTNVASNVVVLELDDDDFNDEYAPGDSLSTTLNIKNNAGEDISVDTVQATIRNFDSEDDVDIDAGDINDIDDGDNEDYDFSIDVPYNVDDAKYDIEFEIKFDGDDTDSTYRIYALWKSAVEVKKDQNRELEFTSFEVNQENPACGAVLTSNFEVVNTGKKDLKDVVIELALDGTDIKQKTASFDLDSDKAKDRDAREGISISLPKDLEAGTYTLRARAYSDFTSFVSEKTKEITVRCGTSNSNDSSEDNSDNEVIDRNNNNNNGGVTGSTVYVPASPFGNLFGSNSTGAVIFWVIVDLILLLVAIWLLKVIFGRRKRE